MAEILHLKLSHIKPHKNHNNNTKNNIIRK